MRVRTILKIYWYDVQQCHFAHEYEDKLNDDDTNSLKESV